MNAETLRTAVAALLQTAERAGDFALHPLPGGGNNRVFRLEMNGSRALLKAYFRHPEDRRDRLGAEYAFCAFAWANGLRSLPQPLACDCVTGLGLYEFIAGRPLRAEEIDDNAVGQALSFFADVNRHRHLPAAQELPIASEAYFCLCDHVQCIERRLRILKGIDPASEIDQEAAGFVRHSLAPAWEQVRSWMDKRTSDLGLHPEAELAHQDRCLSPSDFGFHNAIRTECGRLRFIDFEYAGWDDPAKLVCDFFCQVAMPISAGYRDLVLETVASGLTDPRRFQARAALLMPVYRVKWCCIVLNEFVRVSSNRRRFADADGTREEKKRMQLQKARNILQALSATGQNCGAGL